MTALYRATTHRRSAAIRTPPPWTQLGANVRGRPRIPIDLLGLTPQVSADSVVQAAAFCGRRETATVGSDQPTDHKVMGSKPFGRTRSGTQLSGAFRVVGRAVNNPVCWTWPERDNHGFRALLPHKPDSGKGSYVSAVRADVIPRWPITGDSGF